MLLRIGSSVLSCFYRVCHSDQLFYVPELVPLLLDAGSSLLCGLLLSIILHVCY